MRNESWALSGSIARAAGGIEVMFMGATGLVPGADAPLD